MFRETFAIGQTAVVTLAFPVGARPTAMGEAFTGLANDANAIFYNPAGLGQSPLTLSWKTHMGDSAFTAVAARSAASFGAINYVWAGTSCGVMRFNGKIWEKGETYLPEENESLRSVALRYFATDDKDVINEAVWEIRKENKLGMKRYEQLVLLLESRADLFKNDSIVKKMPDRQDAQAQYLVDNGGISGRAAPRQDSFKSADPFVTQFAKMLLLLPPDEMISGYLQDHILPQSIDAKTRKDLANSIVTTMEIEDRDIGDVTELIIPFTVAIRDTVTALALDASERLWVGTTSGLWLYHNNRWRRYSIEQSERITSVSVSENGAVAVGTEHGLAVTSDATDTKWNNGVFLMSEDGLPDSYITSVAYLGEQLYAGTPRGLAKISAAQTAKTAQAAEPALAPEFIPESTAQAPALPPVATPTRPAGPAKAAVYVTGLPAIVSKPLNSAVSSALVKSKIYAGIEPVDQFVSGTANNQSLINAGLQAGVSYIFAIEAGGQISVRIIDVNMAAELAKISIDGKITALNAAAVAKKIVDFILQSGPKPDQTAQAQYLDDGAAEVFDTASGLLSLGVTALFSDSKGQLWIGGENGITIYSGLRSWKRYKFPGSTIYSFAEQSNGTMWIGTDKGVITHKSGKPVTGPDGKTTTTPEWKTYHSKNALKNDNIHAIAACGKDMWVATDGALHQYANAETQVLLFYEQLLPSFKMTDLWHSFPAIVIPTEDWGTLGFSVNFINMGLNEIEDDFGVYASSRAWEGVFGVSYGFPVKEDLSVGLNAKYICSVLESSSGGWGQTFAIDAGILKRNLFIDRFDVGFMLQNMGPSIYYMTPEEADPIPFSLRLGLAYKPVQTPFHELTLVADAYREVAKNYYDKKPDPFWVALWTDMLNDTSSSFKEEWQEINVSLGAEYMYADFMALRLGFLGDYLGERFELTMGLGVKYANMNFDFSYVYSPGGFMGGLLRTMNKEKDGSSGARDGQWRLSFLFGL
jgi:ligand-binding sensor domain-containing protein